MSSGSVFAPWLMAFGALLVAIAIITNQDISNYIKYRLPSFWKSASVAIIFCAIITIPVYVIFQNIANNQREELANTQIFTGFLISGNEPDPYNSYIANPFNIPNKTPIPKDSIRVMLGDDSGYYLGRNQEYVFALRNQPFLRIKIDNEGSLLINTLLADSTGNYMLEIENNVFRANPLDTFKPRQLNRYTIIVQDRKDEEVLRIKYLNFNTLWIAGKFYSPVQNDTVTIHESGLIDGFKGMQLRGMYMVETNPTGGIINIGG